MNSFSLFAFTCIPSCFHLKSYQSPRNEELDVNYIPTYLLFSPVFSSFSFFLFVPASPNLTTSVFSMLLLEEKREERRGRPRTALHCTARHGTARGAKGRNISASALGTALSLDLAMMPLLPSSCPFTQPTPSMRTNDLAAQAQAGGQVRRGGGNDGNNGNKGEEGEGSKRKREDETREAPLFVEHLTQRVKRLHTNNTKTTDLERDAFEEHEVRPATAAQREREREREGKRKRKREHKWRVFIRANK